MEILSESVKLDFGGVSKNGLTLQYLENLIKKTCDDFSSIDIEIFSQPEAEFLPDKKVMAGIEEIKSARIGYPYPYRCSLGLSLAGLNLGKIVKINNKDQEHSIYIIANIMAKLYRIPKNYEEFAKLEGALHKGALHKKRLNDLLENRGLSNSLGFALESYDRLKKQTTYEGRSFTLVPENQKEKGTYPKVRELHIISSDKETIYSFDMSNLIGKEFTGYKSIRPDKTYPGKILEGLRLFLEKNPSIKNSPLENLTEKEYHEIEINIEKLYSEISQNTQKAWNL